MTHLGTKKHRNCLTSEVVKGKIHLDPDYGIYYGIFFDHGAFELNTLCNNNYMLTIPIILTITMSF